MKMRAAVLRESGLPRPYASSRPLNIEEIDIIYSGLNYGWNEMEASHCYPPGSECNPDEFELPIWEYELYVDDVCSCLLYTSPSPRD